MSTFQIKARRIIVREHPNADALEIAEIFGFQSIVKKGQFNNNDLAIYIPEASIIPDKLLNHIGLSGKLAGKNKNRVKAIKLRGVLSQGIAISIDGLENVYPGKQQPEFVEDSDWQDYLEITKYIPEVPLSMSGEIEIIDNPFFTSYTDIENIKRYPDIIQEGEEIIATEKLHGTCFIAYLLKVNNEFVFKISSKGIAQKSRAIMENDSNVYWRASKKYNINQLMEKAYTILQEKIHKEIQSIAFFGEVLGVQDLKYNYSSGDLGLRFFDVKINSEYANYDEFVSLMQELNLDIVPLLYRGNSISEALLNTGGKTLVNNAEQIREGIVIKPTAERHAVEMGRVILKSISENYLLRSGDATEYE